MNRISDEAKTTKPQQSVYVERYNCTDRFEWLARTQFDTVEQVQNKATR